ncbi:MAG: hypothetical protein AAF483_21585, partial [Planctomycetota bacterium]
MTILLKVGALIRVSFLPMQSFSVLLALLVIPSALWAQNTGAGQATPGGQRNPAPLAAPSAQSGTGAPAGNAQDRSSSGPVQLNINDAQSAPPAPGQAGTTNPSTQQTPAPDDLDLDSNQSFDFGDQNNNFQDFNSSDSLQSSIASNSNFRGASPQMIGDFGGGSTLFTIGGQCVSIAL